VLLGSPRLTGPVVTRVIRVVNMALAVQYGLRAAGVIVQLQRARAAYNRFRNVQAAVEHIRAQVNIRHGAREVRKMPPYQAKKAKSANDNANTHLYGKAVAVGQAATYTKSSSNYGRKTGGFGKYALKKMVQMATQSSQWRFQSLTPLLTHAPGEFSMPLNVACTAVAGFTEYIDLPMYCMNLSANPSANPGTTIIQPFYRARKTTPLGVGLAPGVANYTWTVLNGQNNGTNGGPGAGWNVEDCKNDPTGASTYKHDWANIEILFNCSKHNPCILHVALAKFVDSAGPDRHYYDGTQKVFDDVLDPASHEQSELDVFWESFWAPKIVHPLSSFVNPVKRQHIKFLKHDRITVNDNGHFIEGATTGIVENPTMHLKKLFFNNGRYYNNVRAKASDQVASGDVNPPVVGDATGNFGLDSYGFNTVKRESELAPYGDRGKDVWLIIWSEHFPDPINDGDANKHCSFDFKVRSKYTQMV